MEDRVVVVPRFTKLDEIFTGFGSLLAVQLEVEIPRGGYEPDKTLFLHITIPHNIVLENS